MRTTTAITTTTITTKTTTRQRSVVFFLVCLLQVISSVQGYYSQVCPVDTAVSLVETSDRFGNIKYIEYDDDNDDETNGLEEEISNNTTTVLFRKCQCPLPVDHEPFVCPYHTNLCAVPKDVNNPVLCFEEDTSIVLVRNVWPMICLWYIFLCLLCFSYKGRHAITYCVQKCFPSTNDILVDRIIAHHEVIRQHYWNWWRTNENNNDTNGEEELELILKTKPFHAPELDEEDEQDDDDLENDPRANCVICFMPMEEGERVGDLTCGHVFHVECIKGWVQRKNTCPLCALPMATPKKTQQDEERIINNNNNNNNQDENV